MKKKLKGAIYVVASTYSELTTLSDSLGTDFVSTDVQSLIDWIEYNTKAGTSRISYNQTNAYE
jgi:hypothetical protein